MLLLGFAAGLADFVLGRHRQVFELRHPGRADRRTLGGLRDEGFGRCRLRGLDARDVVIREQRRLLRDRANRDVAIGRLLQRRGRLRGFRGNRRGDRGQRGAFDAAGTRAAALREPPAPAAAASSFWARSAMRALSARSRAVRSARRVSGAEAGAAGATALVTAGAGVPALREISACSMPVATTETRITPSRLSSKVAPTMMLASWSTSSRMRVAASSTSNRVRSLPPVIEISRPGRPSSRNRRSADWRSRPRPRSARASRRTPRRCPSSPCPSRASRRGRRRSRD